MNDYRHYLLTLLILGLTSWITSVAHAVEVVFLKSGSSLLAEGHVAMGERTEVTLMSGAKVYIENEDIDRIGIEDASPLQIPDLAMDPEKLLPTVDDPLNYWLDTKTEIDPVSRRLFLSFRDQVERGEELPLARSMEDVRFARKRRIPKIEFAEMTLYLGMDLQYHDSPGITYEESYKKLRLLEKSPNLERVVEFLAEVRRSARDRRKEQVIADTITLRDLLEPVYENQTRQNEGAEALGERLRQGIQSLRQ